MLWCFQWAWKKLYISIYDPLLKWTVLYIQAVFIISISSVPFQCGEIHPIEFTPFFGMVVTYAYCRFAVALSLCKRCNVMMHIHVVGDVYITQQRTLLQCYQTYNDI